MTDPLLRAPFRTVLTQFRDGTLSPVEYMERFLERIAEREPVVGAFKFLDTQRLREAAAASAARYRDGASAGPLDGIPVGIKDIIETADMPTGFGSPAFDGTRTGRDAACVAALRRAGAIIAGKTVTTEFAFGFSGATRNPHDPERSPGGSSSGSAAALGACMLPLALGTQTQGSMLRPASFNGVVGFKPSFGTVTLGGVHPVSSSHDHLGFFGHHMEDAWQLAAIVSAGAGAAGGHAGLPDYAPDWTAAALAPRRLIRLHLRAWDEVADADRATMNGLVDALRERGVEIVDRHNDKRVAEVEALLDREIDGSLEMLAYEMRFPYTDYVARHGELIGERVRGMVEKSPSITNEAYRSLLAARADAQRRVTALLDDARADGFVMPAAAGAAPRGLAYTGSRMHLAYWSWLGFPAVSLPLMRAEGLPWGLQVMHCMQRDAQLCTLARWFEQCFPILR
ncbi:amidase [Burkholderia sp. WAC0059]|uniref:amidase n=1 Tax=Burkholderia sp. WAC0059 TaxID=2066022 RepID=UPI0015E134D8|nr:amidase [Burkholderia sp. WAC0059]